MVVNSALRCRSCIARPHDHYCPHGQVQRSDGRANQPHRRRQDSGADKAPQKESASTEIEQREGDEILDKTPVERVGASASRLAERDRVRGSRARPDARREREQVKRVLGSSVEDDQWQRLRDHLLFKSRNQDATILKQGRELEDPRRRVS